MKVKNEYARQFGRNYDRIPKAVFAAVALSYANWACGEEAQTFEQAIARFNQEWQTLFENGIVKQSPAKTLGRWLLAIGNGNNALDVDSREECSDNGRLDQRTPPVEDVR